ncbi:MAG: glycylpeptide N-tetradecanoyltransferase [Peltula sp. TS41687]|nr:MAG: glycylpeptide N-tetradecanoyltransferase [Peltula sp. TS41687]
MSAESKEVKPEKEQAVTQETPQTINTTMEERVTISSEDENPDPSSADAPATSSSAAKKRKRKKNKNQATSTAVQDDPGTAAAESAESSKKVAEKKLSGPTLDQLLEDNPSLASEFGGMPREKLQEMLEKVDLSEMLTGLAVGGKNKKDMASYKFWQTQPVPRFDEKTQSEQGPIQIIDPEEVPKEPAPLLEGFNWLEEVYELLNGHYVEDEQAMFRFSYSLPFLSWALKSPGWRKEWHVGVRASQSGKLVAFISGVPLQLRVRSSTLKCSEINFLCIHKKLRSKRLAPVLIKEITRRNYAVGVFQAIYTAGVILPKPLSTCRYYHRSLDWLRLYELGFSPMPTLSNKAKQIAKYKLPEDTLTEGLRPMQTKDVDAVLDLLGRYLARFDMAPVFSKDEVEHMFVHKSTAEQVVWSYVVEDPSTEEITDFFSFYCLKSTAIWKDKQETVRAAYLFYYATETAFSPSVFFEKQLKSRLNELIQDALILAKRFKFDVCNALTLLDNPLFLNQQKFGAGDGRLHYYLYNYRAPLIHGGMNAKEEPDESKCSGVGVVML